MAAEFAAKVAATLNPPVPGDTSRSAGHGGGSDGDVEIKEEPPQQQLAGETDTSGQNVPQHPPGAPQHLSTDESIKHHPSPPPTSSSVIIQPPPPSPRPTSPPAVGVDQQAAVASDGSDTADVSVTCDTQPVVSLAAPSTEPITASVPASSPEPSPAASVPSSAVSAAASVPATSSSSTVVEETGDEAGECDTTGETAGSQSTSEASLTASSSTSAAAVTCVAVSASDAVSRADSDASSAGWSLMPCFSQHGVGSGSAFSALTQEGHPACKN